jgi:hypothetical protein
VKLASKASDGLSARQSSSYEAVVVLKIEASIVQAKQYSGKAKQTISGGVMNETCRKLKVLDNGLAITLKPPC